MLQTYRGISPKVDPTAYVHPTAVLIGAVEIGPGSSVWPNTTLRGDDGPIVIGSQTSIQDGTVVHMTREQSQVSIGDRVTVGHGVILHGCTVHAQCIIGMGATLLDNAVIEAGCIIGAGTLIPAGKRIAAGHVVVGNPFRILRQVRDSDREFIEFSWREYADRTAEYRAAAASDAG